MLLCVLGTVALLGAIAASYAEQPPPYRDLSAAGTAFTDSIPPHVSPDTITAVRVGVLVPLGDRDGAAVLEGVRIALDEANASGGYRGLPYAVTVRATEGPWGVAAKQVAALAYDDNVWAIVGALDGQQAHLAELIAAKAWIPVVTPWASDLTIDYANVPWVFRIAPDDGAQARCLWDYAVWRGRSRIVVATEGTREGRSAQARFLDAARRTERVPALVVEYDPAGPEDQSLRILRSQPDALVVWGRQDGTTRLVRALRSAGWKGLVLGPALCATPDVLAESDSLGEFVVAAPYDLTSDDAELERFGNIYRSRVGDGVRPAAVMAYDVARMVVASIEEAGLNRASIRQAFARQVYRGLSGTYRFGSLGGAPSTPVLLSPRGARWVKVEPVPDAERAGE